jgi:hypothetical protein
VGEPDVVHHPRRPDLGVPLRVVDELQHEAVADEVRRTDPDRAIELQECGGALVGQVEIPPEPEAEQLFVEPARPVAVGNAQSHVVENGSVTGHDCAPPKM